MHIKQETKPEFEKKKKQRKAHFMTWSQIYAELMSYI